MPRKINRYNAEARRVLWDKDKMDKAPEAKKHMIRVSTTRSGRGLTPIARKRRTTTTSARKK